jgi:hypothetical protein
MGEFWAVCTFGKHGNKTHVCKVTATSTGTYGRQVISVDSPVCAPDNKTRSIRMGVPINAKTVTCKVCLRYVERHKLSSSKQQ